MTINSQLSPEDLNNLNYRVSEFNSMLKENQKIVSKNTLDQADFMKLLITQLKSQDPTKPLDDKEFIGQMAQFTSLKEINDLSENIRIMNREFAFTKAVSLVGKTISWSDENSRYNTGVVDSIKVKNGETFLNIKGMEVPLDQITEVRDASTESDIIK
jgi:flagellar basal-body rod modification protein FlgD